MAPSKKKPSGHCWIEFGDNIVDVTATQFGLTKRVFLSVADDFRYQRVMKNDTALKAIEENWPDEQRPSTYKEDIVLIYKTMVDVVNVTKGMQNE